MLLIRVAEPTELAESSQAVREVPNMLSQFRHLYGNLHLHPWRANCYR